MGEGPAPVADAALEGLVHLGVGETGLRHEKHRVVAKSPLAAGGLQNHARAEALHFDAHIAIGISQG